MKKRKGEVWERGRERFETRRDRFGKEEGRGLKKRKGEVWERGRERFGTRRDRFGKEDTEFQFKIVVHVEVALD